MQNSINPFKRTSKHKLSKMSFQAYLDNIKAKTGKTPEDFKKLAEEKGFVLEGKLNPKTKATEITNWLKEEFDLGHGHAMAIFASFKGKTN
jgi:hypothetical protein